MTFLTTHDLPACKDLDAEALAVISGGISFGWIQPYRKQQPSSPFGTTIIGEINVSNTLLINPIFNQTYNTAYQVEIVSIDASENVDSLINVQTDQGQFGRAGSF